MKKAIVAILFVLLMAVGTSVSWGGATWEGATWEGATWETFGSFGVWE
jgi:hypothetical protein